MININPRKKTEAAQKIAEKTGDGGFFDNIEEISLRFFRWTSSFIDKIFSTKKYAVLFAFVLSCFLYLFVNFNDENFTGALSSSKTITNVTVSARYNDESFEVSGIPNACDITFTGDAANVNNATTKNGNCLINLEGYTEGTHTVELIASGYGDNINTVIKPSQAQITLKRKTTAQYDLSYDFINKNLLDSKYILGDPEFSTGTSKVNIRASQDTLNTISLVKALIDVSGQSSDFEVDAPLVAYNSLGQTVNAEIVPNSVKVKVGITSPHKTVPIKLKVTGEAPSGFSLESVSMNQQSTEIYAKESVLANINEVYVNLDLSTITSDSEIIQPVVLPTGVGASDVTMVNLKATLGQSSTKTIDNIALNSINNDNGYGVSYVDTLNVSITVTGTPSNIDSLTASDFYAYVDFAGLEPGPHDFQIQVNNLSNSYINIEVEPKSINLTLVSQE